ncbi:unnamed protein product, partial [Allacma fusca]
QPSAAPRKYLTQVEKISNAIDNGEGDFYFHVEDSQKKYGGITCFLKHLSPGLGKIIANAEAEGKDFAVVEKGDEKHFGLLLKAICTNKWTEKKEDVIPLMVMAEKYEAKFVVDLCVEYLEKVGITVENAVTIFQDSQRYKVVKYEDLAWKFILKNAKMVVAGEDFKKINKSNLEKLMTEDDMEDIGKELLAAFKRVTRNSGVSLATPAHN